MSRWLKYRKKFHEKTVDNWFWFGWVPPFPISFTSICRGNVSPFVNSCHFWLVCFGWIQCTRKPKWGVPWVQIFHPKKKNKFNSAKTFAHFDTFHRILDHPLNWTAYHSTDDIYTFLDYMVKKYPHLCSLQIIGNSYENRSLNVLKYE